MDRFSVAPIDDTIARAVFERNVRDSLLVISGDFETALADIIGQLEDPPLHNGVPLPVTDLGKRIARALRQGFAGLPPNGFEFCLWLWDAAPLYLVRIPSADGRTPTFQHGVIHLRKLAVMVLDLYIDAQPQRVPSLIPLLDSSIDWVDARNLILFALLDHYAANFAEEYGALLEQAREKKVWRKFLALGVASHMISLDASWTAMSLAVIPFTFDGIDDPVIAGAILYTLRAAALAGNHNVLATFLRTLEDVTEPAVQRVISDAVRRVRRPWSRSFRQAVAPVFATWMKYAEAEMRSNLEQTLAILQ